MVNKIQIKLVPHVSDEEFKKLLKSHDHDGDTARKLMFINCVRKGKTIPEASDDVGVNKSTGYRWIDQWNQNGLEGLKPKYKNCGNKSSLSQDQKNKLKVLMKGYQYLNTKKLHKLIKDNFGIDFCESQVRKIAHELGFSYKKGYVIYSKMPPDAEMRLSQSLRNVTLDNSLICFLDQTACQNISNSPTVLCETSEKCVIVQNPDKFSVTGVGIQGINCNSFISFPRNSRVKEMIKFFIESRSINSENVINIEQLKSILKYDNLTINQILDCIENNEVDNELFSFINDDYYSKKSKEQIIKILTPFKEKDKMTKKEIKKTDKKIEEILRKMYIYLLKPLSLQMKLEKQLVVILDNYSVHHAKLVIKSCNFLNIKLIHLPAYSPKLNPIEQVWRTVKKELSNEFIESEKFLIDNFNRIYYENVDKKSFTEKWFNKFILNLDNNLLMYDMFLEAGYIFNEI
jgi:transposase